MELNPYEAPRAHQVPGLGAKVPQILTWSLIVATAITGTPFVLYAAVYAHHRLTHPPSFPGDPDIGFGILMLLVWLNSPVALGWLIWLGARFR